MVKRHRHTPEQIIRKLREADRLLGEGADVAEVVRQLEVSEQTYQRWRSQFGGMKADDVKRLRDLERENTRLKRIVADNATCVANLESARLSWRSTCQAQSTASKRSITRAQSAS